MPDPRAVGNNSAPARPGAPTPTLKPRTIKVHKLRLNQLKQWLMENAGSFPGIIDTDMGTGTHIINYDALQRDPTAFVRFLLSACKTTRGGRPDVKVNRITAHVCALRWAVRTQCDCCFNARFWLSMRNFGRDVRNKRMNGS